MKEATLRSLYAERKLVLDAVVAGELEPERSTRLGAYAGTLGHALGTVGHGVNRCIGMIFVALGDEFHEDIGTLFNSPEAQRHLPHIIESEHNLAIATLEYEYWCRVKERKPESVSARMAVTYLPEMRAQMQKLMSDDDKMPDGSKLYLRSVGQLVSQRASL